MKKKPGNKKGSDSITVNAPQDSASNIHKDHSNTTGRTSSTTNKLLSLLLLFLLPIGTGIFLSKYLLVNLDADTDVPNTDTYISTSLKLEREDVNGIEIIDAADAADDDVSVPPISTTSTIASSSSSNMSGPTITPGNAPDDSANAAEEGVTFQVMRNGETDVCGEVPLFTGKNVQNAVSLMFPEMMMSKLDLSASLSKYHLDAVLTYLVSLVQVGSDRCGIAPNPQPQGRFVKVWNEWHKKASGRPMRSEFLKFCDMIEGERLTIQTDHDKVVKIPGRLAGMDAYPCHFHTREGVRITSYNQLLKKIATIQENKNLCDISGNTHDSCKDAELSLHAVPAGRAFMFAASDVGEIIDLSHVDNPAGNKVYLETISVSPRIFEIHNFFTGHEADRVVHNAVTMTADTHKFKRSSTGAAGYNVNPTRTSENAFDTHSTEAQTIKRRCIKSLGFDTYEEGVTDGLQVLRYNQTAAYIDHMDYIEDHNKQQPHNYDSAMLGSNRFATILLYFNDLSDEAGGQTVFPKIWPSSEAVSGHVNLQKAIEEAREAGATTLFKSGSWEEKLVANCRSKLAITPSRAKAVLFYSQHPDGQMDHLSRHGACPLLNDESKIAANLWVWNAPRPDFPGAPFNDWVKNEDKTQRKEDTNQLNAIFVNSGENSEMDNAKLYFQDTFWCELGKGSKPSHVNTFKGHEWHVKVEGKIVKTFTVGDTKFQRFVV